MYHAHVFGLTIVSMIPSEFMYSLPIARWTTPGFAPVIRSRTSLECGSLHRLVIWVLLLTKLANSYHRMTLGPSRELIPECPYVGDILVLGKKRD
jgi:hypothetical protein